MAILDEYWEEIKVEYDRACEKFPKWPRDEVHGAAIVGEESGELLQAALDHRYYREKSYDKMRKEAIQTGAMVIRFLLEIDAQKILSEAP